MSANCYRIVDAGDSRATLGSLHDQVTVELDRVIVTNGDSSARSVLISERELQGLERALEILSGTTDARAMREEVLRIARYDCAHLRMNSTLLS